VPNMLPAADRSTLESLYGCNNCQADHAVSGRLMRHRTTQQYASPSSAFIAAADVMRSDPGSGLLLA
jgi:hypothetical protein